MPETGVGLSAQAVKEVAAECGFELAGIAPALPPDDFARFEDWRRAGLAGEMTYLTDRRGDLRADPRNLLPSVQSVLCVGKLYNTKTTYSQEADDSEHGWVARYAWGEDYHDILRAGLDAVVRRLREVVNEPFESRVCVDTAPLLERSFARLAGLGWIGKNTCLINQEQGSWFLLGEILLSLRIASDKPPPDRCGTCRRCIDACPTTALVPDDTGRFQLDSRLCISYLTIEKRGEMPTEMEEEVGHHVFGCDICQEVCPWNRNAHTTDEAAFAPRQFPQPLKELANLGETDFRQRFRSSPIWRAKHLGFLRNVAVAMGNSKSPTMLEPLLQLTQHSDEAVSATARRAYQRLLKRSSEWRD